MTIAGRPIGPGHPSDIVAEPSANHHQRFDDAGALVRAADARGADAVKRQTYTPDTITIDRDGPEWQVGRGDAL
jgi:sialic acid synthase SpsE